MPTAIDTIEYTFEETGSRVTDYGAQRVCLVICADRDFSDDERAREAIWFHVMTRMIYETHKRRKPVSVLIDLHKTHGRAISLSLAKIYKDIIGSSSHIEKICIVGDFFQCVPLKTIIRMIPQAGNKINFFLNYQKAKQWLKWTH